MRFELRPSTAQEFWAKQELPGGRRGVCRSAQLLYAFVYAGDVPLRGILSDIDWHLDGALSRLLVQHGRPLRRAEILWIPVEGLEKVQDLVLVGLGDRDEWDPIDFERLAALLADDLAERPLIPDARVAVILDPTVDPARQAPESVTRQIESIHAALARSRAALERDDRAGIGLPTRFDSHHVGEQVASSVHVAPQMDSIRLEDETRPDVRPTNDPERVERIDDDEALDAELSSDSVHPSPIEISTSAALRLSVCHPSQDCTDVQNLFHVSERPDAPASVWDATPSCYANLLPLCILSPEATGTKLLDVLRMESDGAVELENIEELPGKLLQASSAKVKPDGMPETAELSELGDSPDESVLRPAANHRSPSFEGEQESGNAAADENATSESASRVAVDTGYSGPADLEPQPKALGTTTNSRERLAVEWIFLVPAESCRALEYRFGARAGAGPV